VPLVIVAIAVLVAAIWLLFRGEPGSSVALEKRLVELAASRGVASQQIVADDPIRKVDGVFVRSWQFEFPTSTDREGFVGDVALEGSSRDAVVSLPTDMSGEVVRMRIGLDQEAFDLQLTVSRSAPVAAAIQPTATPKPQPTKKPQPPPGSRGRLAILLDDGGQKMDLVDRAAALPEAVGFAILPFLPKSAETANALYKAGHEIWLHLPMEPENYPNADPGPGALLMSMSTDELRMGIHSAINNIPHAVGVNNHMGSKVTADLRTMTWVMQELKARSMMFIDSRTTVQTVAEEAARAQGVPVNRRHVFLDNDREPAAIRTQLEEAVYRSRLEGEIIAIGHMDRVTIAVLAEDLPGLSKRGADLVKPSDLVK
jgi:polysaccharide deacetylase 2 family uncharacterized protein YibQ